jgi:hypothetical protein
MTKKIDPITKKKNILKFIKTNRRLPRADSQKEKRLRGQLSHYIKSNGPCFDPEFKDRYLALCKKLGIK